MEAAIIGALGFIGDRFRELFETEELLWASCFLLFLLFVDIARRGWRLSWSRRAVKGVFATIAIFHINLLFAPFVWLASEQVKVVYQAIGIPSIPTTFWSNTPIWILVPFAVLAYDFADYWSHRVMHMKWVWPIHAIHHSDPDVTGLTAYRIHVLELLVMWVSYTLLLSWLGLPDDAIGAGAVVLTFHTIYVHIDRDWGHGPLALIIASPRFHRWHHADVPAAYGKNLANIFPFYDWLFGTYRVPGPCTAMMGARGVPENDVLKLTIFPFQEWVRMAGTSVATLNQKMSRAGVTSSAEEGRPVPAQTVE